MDEKRNIKKPSKLLLYTDGIRAFWEFIYYCFFAIFYKIKKTGDGHPVLVIPGFLGSGFSTKILRKFIDKHGYTSYDWGLDRNLANFADLEFLKIKIEDLHRRHQQKVTLIGWSLGGVYARQLAKSQSAIVRQVITMGSPFNGVTEPNNAKRMYNWVKKREGTPEISDEVLADLPNPAPVPSTAIYSKLDGIVSWKVCMERQEDATHQNVRINSSHFGFGWNPATLKIVVDRLQYDANNWKHFKR